MLYINKFINLIIKWNEMMEHSLKKKSVLVFVLIVISSIFETLGVTIILPYASAIINPSQIRYNPIVSNILSLLNIKLDNDLQLIFLLSVGIVIIYVVKNVFLLVSDYILLSYENQVQKEYSIKMLRSYVYKSYEENLNINTSEVLRGIGNDATALYYIIQAIFKIIVNSLTILLIGIVLFITDYVMAILVVILSGIISLLILKLLKDSVSVAGKKFNDSMMQQQKAALQILNGYKELTVLNRKEPFLNYYESTMEVQRKSQLKYRFLQMMPVRVLETALIVVIIISIEFRLNLGIDPLLFIPKLSVFAVASIRLLPLLNQITASNTSILYYLPSFNNAYKNLKSTNFLEHNKLSYSNKTLTFEKSIEFRNVSWKYQKSNNNILNNINICINKGDVVGIIGQSGAGKTTFADILLGLLKPTSGGVYVDNINISSNYESWSKMLGYVSQNIYLLDDTIKNNVLFGLKPNDATDVKLMDSLDKSSLKEYIASLEDKENTLVGEFGAKLSGGQRQRIVIARALYNHPKVLVLDEATSALDKDTENSIIESIENIKGDITILIITHHNSLLKLCNRVFKVENGSVIECNNSFNS